MTFRSWDSDTPQLQETNTFKETEEGFAIVNPLVRLYKREARDLIRCWLEQTVNIFLTAVSLSRPELIDGTGSFELDHVKIWSSLCKSLKGVYLPKVFRVFTKPFSLKKELLLDHFDLRDVWVITSTVYLQINCWFQTEALRQFFCFFVFSLRQFWKWFWMVELDPTAEDSSRTFSHLQFHS